MKMPDGGWRPAVNLQIVTDAQTHVIVGVDASSQASDTGLLGPMLDQHIRRYASRPKQWLADSGYCDLNDIEGAESKQIEAIVPPPTPRGKRLYHEPEKRDTPLLVRWRARIGSEIGQRIYDKRKAVCECIHGTMRRRGLIHLPVRGLIKAKCVALLFALAHNFMRTIKLRAAQAI